MQYRIMEPELKYLLKGASSPGALSQQHNNVPGLLAVGTEVPLGGMRLTPLSLSFLICKRKCVDYSLFQGCTHMRLPLFKYKPICFAFLEFMSSAYPFSSNLISLSTTTRHHLVMFVISSLFLALPN